jgi:hypothetical protein
VPGSMTLVGQDGPCTPRLPPTGKPLAPTDAQASCRAPRRRLPRGQRLPWTAATEPTPRSGRRCAGVSARSPSIGIVVRHINEAVHFLRAPEDEHVALAIAEPFPLLRDGQSDSTREGMALATNGKSSYNLEVPVGEWRWAACCSRADELDPWSICASAVVGESFRCAHSRVAEIQVAGRTDPKGRRRSHHPMLPRTSCELLITTPLPTTPIPWTAHSRPQLGPLKI